MTIYRVHNHNDTRLGEFTSRKLAEAEVREYREQTGNAAYVEEGATTEQSVYEVQTWTLCDGWINTWGISEEAVGGPGEDNILTDTPRWQTFPTKEEAQQVLDEFLSDIRAEIHDEGYEAEDYRIVQVAARAATTNSVDSGNTWG